MREALLASLVLFPAPARAEIPAAARPAVPAGLAADDRAAFFRLIESRVLETRDPAPKVTLSKKKGRFVMEAIAVMPETFETALPVIRDFGAYGGWALKGINKRRRGKGPYLIDFDSLAFDEKTSVFRVATSLNFLIGGRHDLGLRVSDELDRRPVARLGMRLERRTPLAREVRGTFRFFQLEGAPFFAVHFTGEARLHWIFDLVPTALMRWQLVERVETVLENARRRIFGS